MDCLLRNQWMDSIGMGGRFAPESVDELDRNMHSAIKLAQANGVELVDRGTLKSLISKWL